MKDLDLLEIAGLVAYDELEVTDITLVNGTMYEVINISYTDYPSGMQAATLQNVETGEYVIAYQGTDPSDIKDIITDISLPGIKVPDQFKDAHEYYKEMKKNYDIKYVCGNSLGGALANYVAINNRDIQSVTYNPAILPSVLGAHKVNNIRNYLGKHDPLTILQLGVGLHEKIPGQHIMVENSISAIQFLVANHVGYVEDGEIKLEGRNTPIKIDLISSLPFSVFTNDFLSYDYQGNGQKITIDANAMLELCKGIEKIQSNLTYAQAYLDESKEIVSLEGNHFYSRLEELQSKCGETFACYELGFLSDSFSLDEIRQTVLDTKAVVEKIIDSKISTINETIYNLFSKVIEKLKYEALNLFDSFINILDILERSYDSIKNNGVPALFIDVHLLFDDGLPMRLNQHLSIIQSNREKLTNRLETYKTQVSKVWSLMEEGDDVKAQAINISVDSIPVMDDTPLEENEEFENIIKEKNNQLENNYKSFKVFVHNELDEAFSDLYDISSKLNTKLTFAISILKMIEDTREWGNKLDEFMPALNGFVRITRIAKNRIDEVLEALKPYIKNAIFNNNGYNDVMIYSLAAYNIYASASVTFEDINYQLSENESQAICKLSDNAGILKRDLLMVMRQIEKGTLK